VKPDEVIIADDGSAEETKKLIESFRPEMKTALIHIWQPDEGFQLAKIRNRAIAAAKSDYIIQIDGDLILHREFVSDHLHLAKKKCFITGSRLLLSEPITKRLIESGQIEISAGIAIQSRNIFNGFRIGVIRRFLANKYKVRGSNKYYVKGCNMSFWRSDLIMVNGYNELYKGWGREDSDIAIRLMNSGVHKKFIKMGAIAYHLYHHEASRNRKDINTEMMLKTIKEKVKHCEKGVAQYL
jgi:glycosyltransferase involved in cell wall biosynthesis